ncbi:PTS system, lactose/cellobiose specific IIA subunit [Vibrio ichthyoenteri ATCC 700023]|uniref:PTS system, lactose/cellobiose specific IIA subunit n=1 Tax=Vibrio ichthyoenteri ATCC 700023 TaxID=870968 RepID=F9S487_9VIBR|nr:PTS lactose/cellobiose transporter subunit IIA [Vibrio ichthyoenteri]EGU37303.1 PTS system, lactose/cellobiose specific IIA subunit [Vibrio ichthyoenteri ATCC 700023]
MDKEQYEEWVMSLIVQAGQCRSMLMNAMREARQGNFASADELISSAKQALKEAHHIQTQLIEYDEGEGKLPVHIVMVHAQDHLMNAVLLMDMAEEIIDLRKVSQA